MAIAPALGPIRAGRAVQPHTALLVNPFYPKDPHASFGKHVLTPTLALTSIAGATPRDWDVRYWDENLLQGPPPADPFPQVVGITRASHVRAARLRAGRVVSRARRDRRPRRPARAVVSGGGAGARRCDRDRRRRAALAADPRATSSAARLQRRYAADYSRAVPRGSAAAPRHPAARVVPHDDQPDRHARLPQPLRLLLSRRPTACTCRIGCATSSRSSPSSRPTASRTPCSSTTTSARGPSTCASSARRCGRSGIIWSAAVTIDVTDDPTLVREMALAGCTGVFVGFESLNEGNLTDARKRTPAPEDYARRVALLHRPRHPGERQLRARLRSRRPDVFARTVRLDRGEPARVRDVPHPHAVSRHAAVPPDGSARAASCTATGTCTTPRTSSSSRST